MKNLFTRKFVSFLTFFMVCSTAFGQKLENKESLVLENIGEIFSNSEHNFVFKPNTAINYLTDSFGLAGFNSPEIARENQITSEVEPIVEAPVSIDNPVEDETPVIPLNGKNRTKN